jgi:hypothetical protein
MRFNKPFIARLAIFTILVAAAALMFHRLSMNPIFSFLLFAATGAVMALFTGLLSLRSFWKLASSLLPLN